MEAVIWIGGPLTLATGLALLFGTRWRWVVALAGLGVLGCIGLLLYAYFSASTYYDPAHSCSECNEHWGRWWEPDWVALVLVGEFFLWCVGLAAGSIGRGLIDLLRARRRGSGRKA